MHCFYLHLQSHFYFVSDPFKQKRTSPFFSFLTPTGEAFDSLEPAVKLSFGNISIYSRRLYLQLIYRNFPFGAHKKNDLSLHLVQALEGIPRLQVTEMCPQTAQELASFSPSLCWFMCKTKRTELICQTITKTPKMRPDHANSKHPAGKHNSKGKHFAGNRRP